MSITASRHSTVPLGEPGVLSTSARSIVPAMPRDNRPRGFTNRIASARPGASRSITVRVPSGVRSRGPKPVPPVVTMTPANPADIDRSASATDSTPSATARRSTTENPCRVKHSWRATPDLSSRVPWMTPSEIVNTFASIPVGSRSDICSLALALLRGGYRDARSVLLVARREHAVGAQGLGQDLRAAASRLPWFRQLDRRQARQFAVHPRVDGDGLGVGERAHAVEHDAPRLDDALGLAQQIELQRRQSIGRSLVDAPSRVGTMTQRAQTRARRVDEYAIERCVAIRQPNAVGDDDDE